MVDHFYDQLNHDQEEIIDLGLENFMLAEDGDRVELVPRAPAIEEEEALGMADGPEPVPEDPPYVDELVHHGGPFETIEDLRRYLRADPDCEHPLWEIVHVGEHDRRRRCVLCDLCTRHQHPYLLQCPECRLRVCIGCGRRNFRLP